MREYENGLIEFNFEQINNPEFEAIASQYDFFRHGSSILIHHKSDGKLICQFNSFDNTVFICETRGIPVAELIGTKRFLVGSARKSMNQSEANSTNAIKFARDLSFPIEHTACVMPSSIQIIPNAKDLSELSERLASSGFTPEKIEEYKRPGNILCRFNPINLQPQSGTLTSHIFLADTADQGRIVGLMIADIIINEAGDIDVYLRDEVVAQPCTMEHLFEAARQVVKESLTMMKPDYKLEDVNVFIRAASGKESSYTALGCSAENRGIYVIHGEPTLLAKMLDEHVKSCLIRQDAVPLRRSFIRGAEMNGEPNKKFHFFNPS